MLASMPLEQNVTDGATLQSLTYGIVFLSIVLTSLLSFLVERTAVSKAYAFLFRGFGKSIPDGQPVRAEVQSG